MSSQTEETLLTTKFYETSPLPAYRPCERYKDAYEESPIVFINAVREYLGLKPILNDTPVRDETFFHQCPEQTLFDGQCTYRATKTVNGVLMCATHARYKKASMLKGRLPKKSASLLDNGSDEPAVSGL